MSPKDHVSETVFLQYLADTLVQMPEEDDLSVRVEFGTKRAARLLVALGDELSAAGQGASAQAFHEAAAQVEALRGVLASPVDGAAGSTPVTS